MIRTTGVIAIACTIAWLTAASLRGDGLGEPTTASKPKLADLMWLHGQWRGQIKGDVIEEYWSKPSADSMTGMFRWLTGGNKTRLFEFLTITQDPSGLTFRFKHFSRDLKGWEEKDESLDFPVATLGRLEGMATDCGNLGLIYQTRGDLKEARTLWTRARDLYEKIGIPHKVAKMQDWLDELP